MSSSVVSLNKLYRSLANTYLPIDRSAQPRAAAVHNDFVHHANTKSPYAVDGI